ncbi:MAG: aquaporin family protein [SAR202 cluster bacterium]|nr:aquaporin family protein [SAR202 cluster bacterium]
MPNHNLLRACVAEAAGTFLLVFIGTGVVAAAVLTGAQAGLWQVAVAWGIAVALAIHATAAVSGAHLNPAITLAFALPRGHEFPWRRVAPYWASQLAGATLAGAVVLVVFGGFIARFEAEHALTRGAAGGERVAMVFGEYFPNPAVFGARADAAGLVAPWMAAAVEGLGAAVLAFVVFALVDRRNASLPAKHLAPVLIGATVAFIISVIAPVTQAGINPARDFGPRVVAFLAGWRKHRHSRSGRRFLGLHRGVVGGRPVGCRAVRPAHPPRLARRSAARLGSVERPCAGGGRCVAYRATLPNGSQYKYKQRIPNGDQESSSKGLNDYGHYRQ